MSRPPTDGLVLVDKPAGWTSHDVVARCRRLLATRRVGHAGTLDPMATGLLVLGVGRATRLLGMLASKDKAYDATIRLGESTVTDDAEGDVVATADCSRVARDDIEAAIASFTGAIQQRPSAVSAIKIAGERAYKRVRAGEDVVLEPRPVTVFRFDVLDVRRAAAAVELDVQVECSTGTYVRALARDLGAALGVGGHLTCLRRTRVGRYGVRDARTLASLEAGPIDVVPLGEAAADNFTTAALEAEHEAGVRNGRPLRLDLPAAGPVALFTAGGEFLALYEQHGPLAKPIAVFANAEP